MKGPHFLKSSSISSLETHAASRSADGSAPERFSLSGLSHRVDARINAVRRDLVDIRFAGRVFAPHYAAGVPMAAAQTRFIRAAAAEDSAPLTQLLAGDPIAIFEIADHRAWGQSLVDGVAGYLEAAVLTAPSLAATHLVAVPSAVVRAEPDADAAIVARLPMGMRVAAAPAANGFLSITTGYLDTDDAIGLDGLGGLPVDWAERLIGVPHVPGGRSGHGVNCSGLVFLAHQMAGIAVPRFSDLQAQSIGSPVAGGAAARGDLVFFADHVAIHVDADNVIHAVPGGAVVREPLANVIAGAAYGPVTGVRRGV